MWIKQIIITFVKVNKMVENQLVFVASNLCKTADFKNVKYCPIAIWLKDEITYFNLNKIYEINISYKIGLISTYNIKNNLIEIHKPRQMLTTSNT